MFKKTKTIARSILLVSILFLPATFLLAQFVSMPSFGTPFDLNGWQINTLEMGTVLTDSQEHQIDAHGICKKVQATDGNMYFVPTRSQTEWETFISKAPNGVNINQCSCDNIEWRIVNIPADGGMNVDIAVNETAQLIVVAKELAGSVYISRDGGNTFDRVTEAALTHSNVWAKHIAMSRDGRYILISAYYGGGGTGLFLSKDYGQSWERISGLIDDGFYLPVDMSSDGKYMIVGQDKNSYVYISRDYGVSWHKVESLGYGKTWGDVNIAKDNPAIMAATVNWSNTCDVYISQDYGEHWSLTLSPPLDHGCGYPSSSVSLSPDGSKVAAIITDASAYKVYKQAIYVSNDSGSTWEEATNSVEMPEYQALWKEVLVNNDNLCLLRTLDLYHGLLVSTDNCRSFTQEQSVGNVSVWYINPWLTLKQVGDLYLVFGAYDLKLYLGTCGN